MFCNSTAFPLLFPQGKYVLLSPLLCAEHFAVVHKVTESSALLAVNKGIAGVCSFALLPPQLLCTASCARSWRRLSSSGSDPALPGVNGEFDIAPSENGIELSVAVVLITASGNARFLHPIFQNKVGRPVKLATTVSIKAQMCLVLVGVVYIFLTERKKKKKKLI